MDLKAFWTTLLRRWYFVVVALMLTAASTYFVVDEVGPTYQAKGAVLLFPPVTTVREGVRTDTVGNPYLMLGGLTLVRDIVIRAMTAQTSQAELCRVSNDPAYEAMRRDLCKPNPSITYQAVPDFTNSAPIILVTVDADSSTNAVAALNAVMGRVPVVLRELQAGLKLESSAVITSTPLVSDAKPEAVHKSQIRAGIVAAAGTFGFGLLIIGFVDGLLAARRVRRPVDAAPSAGWWDVTQQPAPANLSPVAAGVAWDITPDPVVHAPQKHHARVEWDTAAATRG